MVLGTGATIGIRAPEPEPILRTLQTVWMDLADEGLIGSFDEPREYFYGKLVFYYDLFNVVDPPVIFLVGETDQTIVALGGSQKHVRGFRDREIPVSEDAHGVFMEPDVAMLIHEAEAPGALDKPPTIEPGEDIRAYYVAQLYKSWREKKVGKMEFEVLAREELRSSVSPHVMSPSNVLIGSPVFVAQA